MGQEQSSDRGSAGGGNGSSDTSTGRPGEYIHQPHHASRNPTAWTLPKPTFLPVAYPVASPASPVARSTSIPTANPPTPKSPPPRQEEREPSPLPHIPSSASIASTADSSMTDQTVIVEQEKGNTDRPAWQLDARARSNQADATVAYIGTLLRQDSDESEEQRAVLARLQAQLRSFAEVTKKHKAEQDEAARLIQQQLRREAADPDAMQTIEAPSIVMRQISDIESAHQAKKSRTTSSSLAVASSTVGSSHPSSSIPSIPDFSRSISNDSMGLPIWDPLPSSSSVYPLSAPSLAHQVSAFDLAMSPQPDPSPTFEGDAYGSYRESGSQEVGGAMFDEDATGDNNSEFVDSLFAPTSSHNPVNAPDSLSNPFPADSIMEDTGSSSSSISSLDICPHPHIMPAIAASKSITSHARLSEIFLANFQADATLMSLEKGFAQGKFTLGSLKQNLMLISSLLEKGDEDALMASFSQMHLSSSAVSAAMDQTNASDTASQASSSSSSTQPSAIQSVRSTLPQLDTPVSPLEPAENDPDGVARLRITLLFSAKPSPELYQRVQSKGKRKAGGHNSTDDVVVASFIQHASSVTKKAAVITSHEAANSSSSSSSSLASIHDQPQAIHRICQVNKTFEQLFGYTQVETAEMFSTSGSKLLFQLVRRDHIPAMHRIYTRWRHLNVSEGHIYTVRIDKQGREVYCLLHLRISSVPGVYLQGVHSCIPLTSTPPPYVEGVDLTEEVLLHGWKNKTPISSSD